MVGETIINPFATPGVFNPTQAKALLLLYSPRTYDTQVLRPHQYGFTDKTLDLLMNKGKTMTEALARPDVANDPAIASAIRPDDGTNSVKMGMGLYSSLWTFMLVIHQPNNYGSVAMSSNGVRTTVMTGHCIGEPANTFTLGMSTPTINPACQLIVHNRQVFNNGIQTATPMGMRTGSTVMWNDDIIDPSLNMAADNRDLYLMTPSQTLENYDYNGTEKSSICTCGTCAVQASERTPIQATLKTPGIHLNQIVESLDSQTRESQMSEYSPHGVANLGMLSMADEVEAFKAGVRSKLSNGVVGSTIQSGPIDAMSVFTLQEVMSAYPDLDVQFQRFTSPNAQYDVIPQTVMNPMVAYSSFLSSAISSLASDVGLSDIDFMYTSYDPAKRNCTEKDTFQVVSDMTFLTCPPQDPSSMRLMLMGAVDSFKTLFQKQVVPFVTGVVGNFMVTARYHSTGETLVDLKLLDYNGNVNANGWYESPNRLGNFSTTCVGSEAAFQNNGYALNALVLKTQGKDSLKSMGIPTIPASSPMAAPMDMGEVIIPNPTGFGQF